MKRILPLLLTAFAAFAADASAATFGVSTDDDADDGACTSDHCSLREAILAANATPDGDHLVFRDVYVIKPQSRLPSIVRPLNIRGYEDGRCMLDSPPLTLAGGGADFPGLTFMPGSDGSVVCGAVVRGFTNGIEFHSTANQIFQSAVGPNSHSGITVTASRNRIGDVRGFRSNVISGNADFGVLIVSATSTTVAGNLIGTDAFGTAAQPNGVGVYVDDASNHTTIGGVPSAGNVISGNSEYGVIAGDGLILSNRIGTDAGGNAALANGLAGVQALGGIQVGRTGEGNQIAANPIGVQALEGRGTAIEGNTLGLASDGAAPIRSALGIAVEPDAPDVRVAGNTLGAHDNFALRLGAERTLVEKNEIGLPGAPNGTGVYVVDSAAGVDIADNRIAHNSDDGVAGHPRARLAGNAIFANGAGDFGELGIDLLDDGVSPNSGTDGLLDHPVLTAASAGVIRGTVTAPPGTQVRVELFASSACDESGHGQGQTPLGSVTVTAGAGATPFEAAFAGAVGQVVTATATDADSTSEFSACRTRTAAPPPEPPGTALPPADSPGPLQTHQPTPPKSVKVCRVPKLTGLTLAKARRRIARAGCRVGKVTRPRARTRKGHKLVVTRVSRKAGTVYPRGAVVSITLGFKRVKR